MKLQNLVETDDKERQLERAVADGDLEAIRALRAWRIRRNSSNRRLSSFDVITQELTGNKIAVMGIVKLALSRIKRPLNGTREQVRQFNDTINRYSGVLDSMIQRVGSDSLDLRDASGEWISNDGIDARYYPFDGTYDVVLALVRVNDFKRAFLDPRLNHLQRQFFLNLLKFNSVGRFNPQLVTYDEVVSFL